MEIEFNQDTSNYYEPTGEEELIMDYDYITDEEKGDNSNNYYTSSDDDSMERLIRKKKKIHNGWVRAPIPYNTPSKKKMMMLESYRLSQKREEELDSPFVEEMITDEAHMNIKTSPTIHNRYASLFRSDIPVEIVIEKPPVLKPKEPSSNGTSRKQSSQPRRFLLIQQGEEASNPKPTIKTDKPPITKSLLLRPPSVMNGEEEKDKHDEFSDFIHPKKRNNGHSKKPTANGQNQNQKQNDRHPPSSMETTKKYILCVNRSDCQCIYAHSLTEWIPKQCNFQKKCFKNEKCPYIHEHKETKECYLKRMLQTEDTFYFKNKHKFSKYL